MSSIPAMEYLWPRGHSRLHGVRMTVKSIDHLVISTNGLAAGDWKAVALEPSHGFTLLPAVWRA